MPRPTRPTRLRAAWLAAALLLLAGGGGAWAQGSGEAKPAAGPTRLPGEHGAWIAATHLEGGQRICYAFTRPTRSEPAGRQNVLLTVTHRPNQRDAVIMTAGQTFARNAEVKVSVGGTDLDFYTAGSSAAARDNAAAIRAFRGGREAVARGPAASGRGTTTDTFSLAGFTAAYEAISKACPAQAGGGSSGRR